MRVWLGMLAAVVLVAGCGRVQPLENPTELPPAQVQVAKVSTIAIPSTAEATGTVEAIYRAEIAPKIMARVEQVNVREGDRVHRGQLLVRLDDADLKAGVAQAEAALAQAEAARSQAEANLVSAKAHQRTVKTDYDRAKALYEQEVIPKQQLDHAKLALVSSREGVEQAKAQVERTNGAIEQAEAAVRSAKVMLSYAVVKAPISGIVAQRLADPGDLASPGMPLLVVDDDSRYRLACAVPESDAVGLKKGMEVTAVLDALGGDALPARIAEIVPAADPASRTVTVKCDLPRREGLKSGMFGRIQLPSVKGETTMAVPEEAVVIHEGVTGVWVARDGRASLRVVRTGKRFQGLVAILSGLNGDESVIVSGQSGLREGQPVTVQGEGAAK